MVVVPPKGGGGGGGGGMSVHMRKRQMASEAVVSFVVGKLGDLLIQEAQLLFGVREGIEGIKNELEWMQRFLKDADSKQTTDEIVKKWVSDIRDVSYEIEDVIETFIYSQRKRHGLVGLVKWGISKPKTRHEVAKQIEQIKQKISDISRRRSDYGIRDVNEGRQEASSSIRDLRQRRQFFAILEEPEVVGQQEEISTLKKQLINGEQRRSVISIFGMGGLGKTTLARQVYHDVKNDFDCHAFICLSQQYEMKDVLIHLITCAMGKLGGEIENLPIEELGMRLREHLKGKRYLVVIDDIWSTKAWDDLKLILPDTGKSKSRVMLTTRIKDVAVHADPVSRLHEMRLLNDNEGWELFMKKVFPGENPSAACPSELEETGREIFAKCGGLPLAILVLGGLLATKEKTFREWSNVLKCVPRHLTESSEGCMEILALSYRDLPYYLKSCFFYLGLFQEDYEISSKILIRLWIAEGFIQQRDGELMEDVAECYLEELVSRSMIQVVAKKSNGSVDKCRVHDLLRDLSITEARQNNFFTIYKDNGTSSSSTSVRRLAFHGNVDGYDTSKGSTESLRSILYFSDSEVPLSKLLNTRPKLLRVLKTAFVDFSKVTLPKDIGVFAHLRYLEIGSHFPLPSSIGNLSNLQTLHVGGSATLPNAISNLKQLRHLQALWSDIDGHPRLENLRNLCTLYIGAGSWIKDGLDELTNLRELKITGGISSYHKALSDSVQKLRNLQLLDLQAANSCPTFMPFTGHLHLYEMYLVGKIGKIPELPPNLAKLTLNGSELQEDGISTLEKLSNLKILKLCFESYISKKMICSSGGFPRLEFLLLVQLSIIEELIVEEGAMPVIKSVTLNRLSNLSKTTLPDRVSVLVKRSYA
ncbi:Disease resistance protein [Cinnamomum micranthum f. kanehirae]|uniref:Disease resistance protein n=1 Tax=Cinnamomum micranthum f. kanehirae TaxID=337451 RepID=A0A3S3NQ23_9MAGN|nr:Disease resistance protein [Cinnamomum micranthum f. kanehirae]